MKTVDLVFINWGQNVDIANIREICALPPFISIKTDHDFNKGLPLLMIHSN